jgi:hypothetical protein
LQTLEDFLWVISGCNSDINDLREFSAIDMSPTFVKDELLDGKYLVYLKEKITKANGEEKSLLYRKMAKIYEE